MRRGATPGLGLDDGRRVTIVGIGAYAREVFQSREVLRNLVLRDLKLKYKGTVFGYLWSLLNPVLQLAVLTAVFSGILKVGTDDYLRFLFPGVLGWSFFQTTVLVGATSFVDNQGLMRKIEVSKVLFPLSNLCVRSVDFAVALVPLTAVGVLLGISIGPSFALVPVAAALLGLFAFGLSIVAAVAFTYFRDLQYLLGVVFQLGYFLTPVLYPLPALPPEYRSFAEVNPVYLELRLLQQIVSSGTIPPASEWLIATVVALISVMVGLWVLRSHEGDLVFRL